MSGLHIRLAGVTLRRSPRFALAIGSQHFAPGVTVVRGPNGGGKSTLLQVLATALRPQAGTMDVDGRVVADEAAVSRVRATLGYLPQRESCHDRWTVYDHVDLVAVARQIEGGLPRRRRAAVGRVLGELELEDLAAMSCGSLSGGQRRRVELAAALVGDPRLLVLDEPDTGLDADHRRLLAGAIGRRRQATVVLATQDVGWISAHVDQALTIHDGQLV